LADGLKPGDFRPIGGVKLGSHCAVVSSIATISQQPRLEPHPGVIQTFDPSLDQALASLLGLVPSLAGPSMAAILVKRGRGFQFAALHGCAPFRIDPDTFPSLLSWSESSWSCFHSPFPQTEVAAKGPEFQFPPIQFLASHALRSAEGVVWGQLLVMDSRPLHWTPAREQALAPLCLGLARILEWEGKGREGRSFPEPSRDRAETHYRTLAEALPQNVIRKDTQGRCRLGQSNCVAAWQAEARPSQTRFEAGLTLWPGRPWINR